MLAYTNKQTSKDFVLSRINRVTFVVVEAPTVKPLRQLALDRWSPLLDRWSPLPTLLKHVLVKMEEK